MAFHDWPPALVNGLPDGESSRHCVQHGLNVSRHLRTVAGKEHIVSGKESCTGWADALAMFADTLSCAGAASGRKADQPLARVQGRA